MDGGLPILWRWAPVRSQRRTGTIGVWPEFTPSRWLAGRRTPWIPRSRRESSIIWAMTVAAYSDVYGEIAGIRDFQSQELLLESSLSFLSADQQLDSSSRNDALSKLGQLDALNATNAGLSSLILDQLKGLHLHVDRARSLAQLEQTIADARKYHGTCVKDVHVQF
jgi:hypothetical protein